jgi:hypothetical protein
VHYNILRFYTSCRSGARSSVNNRIHSACMVSRNLDLELTGSSSSSSSPSVHGLSNGCSILSSEKLNRPYSMVTFSNLLPTNSDRNQGLPLVFLD